MDDSEHFCLRWNDFESNISATFRSMREEKDFFDVTLACEDRQVQAHKVILAACSPFFRNVLRRNPHQHPLLFLKGVRYSDISSILSFMYHGEVNVTQEDLNTFLSTAEELQVKGLTQEGDKKPSRQGEPTKPVAKKPPDNQNNFQEPPPQKRPRNDAITVKRSEHQDIQEVSVPDMSPAVKVEPVVSEPPVVRPSQHSQDQSQSSGSGSGAYEIENYDSSTYDSWGYEEEQYDQAAQQQEGRYDSNKDMTMFVMSLLKEGIDHEGKKNYTCSICDFTHARKQKVRQHVESWHGDAMGIRYKCDFCDKNYKCHSNLRTHVSSSHRPIIENERDVSLMFEHSVLT